jgi:hypothetical protein
MLQLQETVLGKDHPDTLIQYDSLFGSTRELDNRGKGKVGIQTSNDIKELKIEIQKKESPVLPPA